MVVAHRSRRRMSAFGRAELCGFSHCLEQPMALGWAAAVVVQTVVFFSPRWLRASDARDARRDACETKIFK